MSQQFNKSLRVKINLLLNPIIKLNNYDSQIDDRTTSNGISPL